ncbi:unnamed protein product [Thelazia callipaeda]|uniref:Uncharacterized protein n=1 Tax=Thelazia callipaeda TaxID=103827 RepID=A0A0N5CYX9_THECL|nr:unnamed protein product [Thelazia callipaeda]
MREDDDNRHNKWKNSFQTLKFTILSHLKPNLGRYCWKVGYYWNLGRYCWKGSRCERAGNPETGGMHKARRPVIYYVVWR